MTTDNKTKASYSEQYLQQRQAKETVNSLVPGSTAAISSFADLYTQASKTQASPETKPDVPQSQAQTQQEVPPAEHGDTDKESVTVPPKTDIQPRAELVTLPKKVERQLQANSRELEVLQINLTASGMQTKSLCFSSCFDGEGKSTAALSAAYGLASGGNNKVLLVDANIRRPRLHKLFSTSQQPGLKDILSGNLELEDVIHPSSHKGLDFISLGQDLEALLLTSRFERFLESVEYIYDYIIVDTSAVLTSSEVTRLVPLFDGTVMVVACEQTKWDVVKDASDKIRNAGGEVIGITLNKRRFYIPRRIYKWVSR
ncbi:MAG: CpsD/CapB family tyrosine-protein kinase [Endozoicomonas sp.]